MAQVRKRYVRGVARWQVRWYFNGKEVSETFATEGKAKEFRGLVDANRQQYPVDPILGPWVPHRGFMAKEPPKGGMTLREWFPRAIAARPRASAALKARYQRQFDIYVPASLADIPMNEISEEAAGVWVAGLTTTSPPGDRRRQAEGESRWARNRKRKPTDTRPASPKTAHNVFGTISSAVKQAVRNEHVKRNVFEGLGAGLNKSGSEQVHLDEEEFELVRAELRPDFAELARWAFLSGMRFGEITALQWRDLDYEAGKARVRRAWKKGPGGVYYLGEPKGTSKSLRTIVMDPDMMATVRLRDPRQPGLKVSPAKVEGLVFPNSLGERMAQSVYYKTWLRAVAAAQVKGLTKRPRFHDLRHSHATVLLGAGVNIVAVSRRLGHSSVAVTGDLYGHQAKGDDAAILAAFSPKGKK